MNKILINSTPLFLFLLLVNFTKCKSDDSTNFRQPWEQINIRLDGQMITIFRQKGYPVYSRILTPKDTTQDFVLADEQKDSIYNIVYDLIKNPVTPEHYVNAGVADNVTFSINYKQVDLSADYKYLKSWRDLSDKTNTLYSILSRKIKFVRQL